MYFYLFIQFFCYFCGVADSLRQKILSFFPYEPTAGQAALLNKLSFFLGRESQGDIFLLKGYAGTGKTSVVGALVKCFTSMNVPIVLAAPTGRAAKVLSQYAEHQAYTIHKLIYRQRTSAAETRFELGFNRLSNAQTAEIPCLAQDACLMTCSNMCFPAPEAASCLCLAMTPSCRL